MNAPHRSRTLPALAALRPWIAGVIALLCVPWAVFEAMTLQDITVLQPVVVPQEVAGQPYPSGARRPLRASDFELIGAMKVPEAVGGFGRGGLAMRRVDGEIRFLITGSRRDNDPVFEIDVPGFSPDLDTAPRARLIQRWGDVYEGRKRIFNTENAVWTKDLEWFDGRLYWVYGDSYNVVGAHNPSLGTTVLGDQPFGPWRTVLHSNLTQGFITTVPKWYADRFLDGRRLAVGSGLRASNLQASWGPALAGVEVPGPDTSTDHMLQTVALVQYPDDHRLERDSDYIPLTRPPDLPGGWWTQQDLVNGVVWIDLPDKHGVVFMGTLVSGHVWYGGQMANDTVRDPCGEWQGPHAEGYARRWWIYDPLDFAPASGESPEAIDPFSVFDPHEIAPTARNCLGETTGSVFDPMTRTLFVVNLEAEPIHDELSLPVIYAYRIR